MTKDISVLRKLSAGKKGDRAAFGEGLDMLRPFGDVFFCYGRGGANFTTPWWCCSRWSMIYL